MEEHSLRLQQGRRSKYAGCFVPNGTLRLFRVRLNCQATRHAISRKLFRCKLNARFHRFLT